jgi:hemerythrin-like domain-containing protein
MDLFETLTDEHRLITRTMDALEAFIEPVEKGAELDGFELNRFVVFLHDFVDLIHHDREESILFPAMARLGYSNSGAPIAHVRDEHRREHKILFEIRQAAVRARPPSSARRAHLVGLIRELITFQRDHIKKENELLYPSVKKEFSGKTLDEVTRLLWTNEEAQTWLVEDSWLRALAEELIRDHPRVKDARA